MSRLALAWIHLRSQAAQLAAASAVIALGVGLSAGMLLANSALRESFEESLDALSGRGHLQIRTAAGGSLPEATLEAVRNVSGIKAAGAMLLGSGFVDAAPPNEPVRLQIVGIDMLDEATTAIYDAPTTTRSGISEPLIFLSQSDSVVLPTALARRWGLNYEDTIAIDMPTGPQTLTVRGLLDSAGVGRAFGGELAIMDIFSAQEVLASPNRVSHIDVVLEDPRASGDVAARLRAALPDHLAIETLETRKGQLNNTVAGFQAMLNAIAFMGLLLAAIITANRLATVYQERFSEMGILRGMGWTPNALVLDLLAEAFLVGLLAAILGCPLGIVFADLIVEPIADTMALNFKQLQRPGIPDISIDIWPMTIAAVAGIISGLAAAWVPAMRSAKLSVAVLKAKKRRRDPWPETRTRTLLRFGVSIGALVAIFVQYATGSIVSSVATIILVGPAAVLLIQPGLRLTSRPVRAVLGEASFVGVSDQSRAPSRAIGAVATLMTGVALVVWIGTTGQSFEQFVVSSLMTSRQGDLIVDSEFNDYVGAVGEKEPRLPESILDRLRAIPGVRAVGAGVSARTRDPETGILAIDPVRLQNRGFGDWRLQAGAGPSALEDAAAGRSILIDETLASSRNLVVGDTLTLSTPSGPLSLPIAGIVAPSFQSPTGDAILSRNLYRQLWSDNTVTRAFILTEDGSRTDVIRDSILDSLGSEHRLRVSEPLDLSQWFAQSVRSGFSFLDTMAALTMLVVVIGTSDALAANVVERTREIGTLRSIGYTPLAVGGMVLAQALSIGIVGSTLAIGLGLAMSSAFVEGVLQSILGWELRVHPSYSAALSAAGLGVLACVIGGIIPAVRASRLSIAAALRYD